MIFKTQSRYYLPTYANHFGEGEIKQMILWCDLRRENGQKELAAPSSVAGEKRIVLPEKQGKKMLRRQAAGIISVHIEQPAPSFPLWVNNTWLPDACFLAKTIKKERKENVFSLLIFFLVDQEAIVTRNLSRYCGHGHLEKNLPSFHAAFVWAISEC